MGRAGREGCQSAFASFTPSWTRLLSNWCFQRDPSTEQSTRITIKLEGLGGRNSMEASEWVMTEDNVTSTAKYNISSRLKYLFLITRRPHDLEIWLFTNLIGHVYVHRLRKTKEQLPLANQLQYGFADGNNTCTHAFTTIYGLPCSHSLIVNNLEERIPLRLQHIHHWWFSREIPQTKWIPSRMEGALRVPP